MLFLLVVRRVLEAWTGRRVDLMTLMVVCEHRNGVELWTRRMYSDSLFCINCILSSGQYISFGCVLS